MLKVHQYTALCAPTPSQYAAVAALKEGREDGYHTVADMKAEYDRRRRYVVGELNDMGLKCRLPGGAFYVFANVSSTGMDGQRFARGPKKWRSFQATRSATRAETTSACRTPPRCARSWKR